MLPCKKCLKLAICINKERIVCDDLFDMLSTGMTIQENEDFKRTFDTGKGRQISRKGSSVHYNLRKY